MAITSSVLLIKIKICQFYAHCLQGINEKVDGDITRLRKKHKLA